MAACGRVCEGWCGRQGSRRGAEGEPRSAAGGRAAISKRCARAGEVSRRTAARRQRCHPLPPPVRATPTSSPHALAFLTRSPAILTCATRVETERSPLLAFKRSLTLALHLNVRCSFLVELHCRNLCRLGKARVLT